MSSLPLPLFSGKSSSPSFSYSLVPFQRLDLFRSTSTTRSFSCVFYSLKAKAMAELIQDKESIVAAAGGSGGWRPEVEHSRTFLEARSEQELLSGIRKEVDAGRLPPNVAAGMEEFYQNYRNAVFQSGDSTAGEIVLSNMAVAFDRMLLDVEDPFVFEPYHKALREPFDYYMFGQNYIRPLIDFRNSYVGNLSLFYEIEEKLKLGHNIVLISNHQTEADPAVIALMLEKTNPYIAENMIYVAGDRVITDPLCKPFSMGRNLICVYSKNHMYDVPELAEMKRKANIRSLKEMALLLRGGSKIVWIAPSGGRDRPDPLTGEWYPAPFDSSSVDNMKRLIEHSGAPGHIYPLALLCYDIMPPPVRVEKEIGEKRIINFHGAGLSVAPKISIPEIAAGCEKPEEAKDVYTQALYKSVSEQYNVLKSAIHGKQGLEASTAGVSLSQPWN
ncbi:glycerol-3-phosphate acyltransferase, chloroplastic-like isoform X1 [Durio zibethinus]|uniref:Glycerol-3-phosphate acyltransferase, chloroplastic n=1 Tax=Durio zibethinus TaxID=66656 RepID=A0A6P5WNC0_DURZI|nr:glycerol-3-phosphate acyltransferase, chloroplastic-like isoform X1 [Durio zibethinus]XP_022717280.1 glycerol-3-phosphate acyltransferase, chloroplastic-like isoform X1 [Durio zibethinus]XP_022717285.1 glycerol-3-phosphate acyltransferase, chloroplastic-like isoform X1 [Durio zibethinus]XP_022717292.1 glycerol-3-phosphate acyltransferase, chloroplastic-like isoform X1 [Durio zibethinus]XP_022717301.1 glycerol-3-phosphate acyltransferase, chloroplastic-like isoform X1 [Durio zibethinus]XP_02